MNESHDPENFSSGRTNIWTGEKSKKLVISLIVLVSTFFLVLGLPSAIVFFLFFLSLLSPELPDNYVHHVSTDTGVYAGIEELDSVRFGNRTYCYDQNQYLDVLDGKIKPPKVADQAGRLPVLKFDGDIYIITTKWVNDSGGIAISDDPNFKSKLESFDHCFRVTHVKDNLFTWSLDLERPLN